MALNQQTLKGHWNEIKGQIREHWGNLTNDDLESAHGNVEQLVGTIQRKTGEARESVEKYLAELTEKGNSGMAKASETISKAAETAREYADSARETMSDSAKQAMDAARQGYAKAEQTVQMHPMESMAVCFGVGLITGVVVGLMMRSK